MKYSLSDDFLNSNKILYPLMERMASYARGNRCFPPYSVEVHPTAACNHRCIHCSYEERNQNRASLPHAAMDRLVESFANMGVKGVYFSGGGEPCVYPRLAEYIGRIHAGGAEVAIITNGTLAVQSGVAAVADHLNYMAVSVPSVQPAVFEKITGVGLLDRVLALPEHIKGLHGEKSPVIGARVVVTSLIAGEVRDILCTLKSCGYDYVLYKIVRDYEDRGLGVDDDTVKMLKESIAAMESEGLLDPAYTNLKGVFDYRKPIDFTGKCYVNDMGLIANISPEGDVYPNIVEIDDEDFCVGNIVEKPLEEVWNSARHDAVKKASCEKWASQKCKNCRAISYNKIIEGIAERMPAAQDSFI